MKGVTLPLAVVEAVDDGEKLRVVDRVGDRVADAEIDPVNDLVSSNVMDADGACEKEIVTELVSDSVEDLLTDLVSVLEFETTIVVELVKEEDELRLGEFVHDGLKLCGERVLVKLCDALKISVGLEDIVLLDDFVDDDEKVKLDDAVRE